MGRFIAVLTVVGIFVVMTPAQQDVPRGGTFNVRIPEGVNVNNFPDLQKVNVTNSVISVKESDITRSYQYEMELGTGDKRAFGPIPLDGRHRIQIQLSQLFPKVGTPNPATVRWYVRYHPDDAFFDPCSHEPNAPICTTGFPPAGGKLRPLRPASLSDLIDGFYVMDTTATVNIATIDSIGVEGLLVIENTASSPRTLRANLVLDR